MFLPEDYEPPKSSSSYLKLKDGETKIRILSQPIFGWEDWKNKKPIRFHMDNKPMATDPKKPVKHFWAFIVYNYSDAEIQIMQVTQSTIRKALESFSKDEDWGNPFEYDIKINKAGEGIETEYTINPIPHKKISAEILEAFKAKPINLDALFEGTDPFAIGQPSYTKLMYEGAEEVLSETEISQLTSLVSNLDSENIKSFHEWIKKTFNTDSLINIPKKSFDTCMVSLNAKIKYLKDKEKTMAVAV